MMDKAPGFGHLIEKERIGQCQQPTSASSLPVPAACQCQQPASASGEIVLAAN